MWPGHQDFKHSGPSERGAGVAQLEKHLTLDFGSGYDLRVVGSSPMPGSSLSGSSRSLLLSLSVRSFSLSGKEINL